MKKERKDKRAKCVIDSLAPIGKATQQVVEKCARENFNTIWITTTIQKIGDRLH
jgi:Leu/Phe-tRNA-protein transferase